MQHYHFCRDLSGLGDRLELLRLLRGNGADGAGFGIPVRTHVQRDRATLGGNFPEPLAPAFGRLPNVAPSPFGAEEGQRMPLRAIDPAPGGYLPRLPSP